MHIGVPPHISRGGTDVDDTYLKGGCICSIGGLFCSLCKYKGSGQQHDQQKDNALFHVSLLTKDCVMSLMVLEEPQLFQIIRDDFPAVKTLLINL